MNLVKLVNDQQFSRLTFEEFTCEIEHEFISGSGISPSLYEAAIRIVADTEILSGNEVSYPIAEALNWRVTRFGHQARENLFAALFCNEDGSIHHSKLSRSLEVGKKAYCAPSGGGSRGFLPPVPAAIRQQISQQHGIEFPSDGSFWDFVELHPEVPIVITEGDKKSLCLLSSGSVSIALYGVNSGVLKWDTIAGEKIRKLKPELIPDLARFAHPDRHWVLAFDEDLGSKTRYKVDSALGDLAFHLEQTKGKVLIAQWDGQNGCCKGVDDLIVSVGVEAWQKAVEQAIPAQEWRISRKLARAVRRKPDRHIGTREFKDIALELPIEGAVVLYGGKGTAKSEAISVMLRDRTWLSLTALRSVARDQATSFGGIFTNDGDRYGNSLINEYGQPVKGGSVCLPSLLKVQRVSADVLVLDETTALAEFLLISKLANKDGLRPLLLAEFTRRVQDAKLVVLADADLTQEAIDWIERIRGERSYLVRSDLKALTYKATIIDGSQNQAIAMLQQRAESLATGKILYINSDSKALAKALTELLGSQQSLLIDSDTSSGKIESSFLSSKGRDLPSLIAQGIRFIVSSPSVCQGFSIQYHTDLIDSVWGFYSGRSIAAHAMGQGLDRVRATSVDRFIHIASQGSAYSRLSRAQSVTAFLREFKQLNTTAARLVRLSLTPETVAKSDKIDWQNQNLEMLASLEVRRNQGMMALRHTLTALLKQEGKSVSTIKASVSRQESRAVGQALRGVGKAIKAAHYATLASADDLTPDLARALSEKTEALTSKQILSLEKFYMGEFYRLSEVTIEDATFDQDGKTRTQIRNLEMVLNSEIASSRTVNTINKSPECPQDWDVAAVKLWLLEKSGAATFVQAICAGKIEFYDLSAINKIAIFCKAHALEFKIAFGFSNVENVSPMQTIGVILDWCGIKRRRYQTSVEGVRVTTYVINKAYLAEILEIVSRRGNLTPPPSVQIEAQEGVVAETFDNSVHLIAPERFDSEGRRFLVIDGD